MGLITVIKQQKIKWSKTKKDNVTDLTKVIDLPNGVTLRGQKKKHKFFPSFFSSIVKSKYNTAIATTNNNNSTLCEKLNKFESIDKIVKFAESKEISEKSFTTSKLLNAFDSESTILNDDLYDSENTVQENNIPYLKYISGEVADEYESTVGTVVSEDECNSFTKVFLTRKNISLNGRKEDTIPVLTEYLAEIIRSRLPKLLQEATKWNLMYSLDQHGARLSTLYRLIEDQGPCVIVLKNSENEVFGAFVNEPFKPSNKGFFGSPECFLWKSSKYQFKKYAATNRNEYFMLADPTFIAMGGGNGNFGLYLDEDIHFGSTSACDTFENEALTENKEFEVYGCEVWGFEY